LQYTLPWRVNHPDGIFSINVGKARTKVIYPFVLSEDFVLWVVFGKLRCKNATMSISVHWM
jgi:hypothetical protein